MTLFTDKAPGLMRDLMRDLPWGVLDAAACVGNLAHESGGFRHLQEIKPTVAGSKGGYGWAQWTGPRRRAFEAWCKQQRLSPASDEANYGYLLVELRGSEKATVPAVAKAVGLEAKVMAFEAKFERAGVKHYPSRIKYAQQALAAFEKPPKPVPGPDVPIPTLRDKTQGTMVGIVAGVIAALAGGFFFVRDWLADVWQSLFN